ncbi:MAG TPA: hypothetical protein VGE47_02880 [Burkholderiaceae bacterium]
MHLTRQTIAQIPTWLAEARFAWWGLAAVVAAVAAMRLLGPTEPVIRITGLVLQVFGIGTVVWGISETRALYGHKPFRELALNWLTRFPLLSRSATAAVSGSASNASMTAGRAHGTVGAGGNATLEERVAALEKNIPMIHARITSAEKEFDAGIQRVTDAIAEERRTRTEQDGHLSKRLELTATGGMHISAMGAFWLFVGVTLSTAALEISKWLV